MKLRLQSNSVRFRLKRAEVADLAKTGRVEEKIIMGPDSDDVFSYVLEASASIPALQATLGKHGILVQVPAEMVSKWASGNDVGIEATLPASSDKQLQVLIEKDFACLNGPAEQNIDTFPNPLEGTKC